MPLDSFNLSFDKKSVLQTERLLDRYFQKEKRKENDCVY